MAIKKLRPCTPAQRGMTSQDFEQITTNKPVKSLLVKKKQRAGRNNMGRITSRHRGGGVKRFIRLVDFRQKEGLVATVEHIEYDPGRSARIARLRDQDGNLSYTLATSGMKQGQVVKVAGSDAKVAIEPGNRMKLKDIPLGASIHNIELVAGQGGKVVRAAGTSAQLTAKEGDYAMVRMPSGEVRKFRLECQATLGVVSNEQHQNIKIGSAGRKRHMGIRPHVRGTVMNACDHPQGGGEGSHSAGKPSRTPWGKLALGQKTRRRKSTNRLIVRSRHDAKRRK